MFAASFVWLSVRDDPKTMGSRPKAHRSGPLAIGKKLLALSIVELSQNAQNLNRDVSMGESGRMTGFDRLTKATGGLVHPRAATKSTIVWLVCVLGVGVTVRAQDRPMIGGKSLGHWVATLKGNDSQARHTACTEINLLGPGPGRPCRHDRLLDDPRQDVQKAAIRSLRRSAPTLLPPPRSWSSSSVIPVDWERVSAILRPIRSSRSGRWPCRPCSTRLGAIQRTSVRRRP